MRSTGTDGVVLVEVGAGVAVAAGAGPEAAVGDAGAALVVEPAAITGLAPDGVITGGGGAPVRSGIVNLHLCTPKR